MLFDEDGLGDILAILWTLVGILLSIFGVIYGWYRIWYYVFDGNPEGKAAMASLGCSAFTALVIVTIGYWINRRIKRNRK